jgi:hypothetical protein
MLTPARICSTHHLLTLSTKFPSISWVRFYPCGEWRNALGFLMLVSSSFPWWWLMVVWLLVGLHCKDPEAGGGASVRLCIRVLLMYVLIYRTLLCIGYKPCIPYALYNMQPVRGPSTVPSITLSWYQSYSSRDLAAQTNRRRRRSKQSQPPSQNTCGHRLHDLHPKPTNTNQKQQPPLI